MLGTPRRKRRQKREESWRWCLAKRTGPSLQCPPPVLLLSQQELGPRGRPTGPGDYVPIWHNLFRHLPNNPVMQAFHNTMQ